MPALLFCNCLVSIKHDGFGKRLCLSAKINYHIAQNFDGGKIFDGYRLFKYLMENILTDGHCLSPYTCKCCIVIKQFDGLNFDGLAGKHQKRQNFPPSKFCAIRYTVSCNISLYCDTKEVIYRYTQNVYHYISSTQVIL